jgi:SAM-dependent methyltransferase
MLSSQEKTQITKIFNSLNKESEFEIMFNNYKKDNKLNLHSFMNVLKYIKYLSIEKKYKLEENIILDIIYGYEDKNIYRGSIIGIKDVNSFLGLVHERHNNTIFSMFINNLDKTNYKLIKKEKSKDNIVDIDNYDIRFRTSQEIPVKDDKTLSMLKKLKHSESEKIVFRFKQRISLIISPELVIDMTIVKMANNVKDISTAMKSYELEIDYSPINKKTNLDDIFLLMENVKKVLDNNDILLSKEEEDNIITSYKNIVYGSDNLNFNNLYSMQPVNAEIPHIIDIIPNKYSVTDKADGEKYQLYIDDKNIYLISNNLHVRKLNSRNYNIDGYKNTIMEGEYIYLTEKKVYLFMIFDILYLKGDNVMKNPNLIERYNQMVDTCKNISKNEIYKVKSYSIKDKFSINDMENHYNTEIKNFYDNLNKEIGKMKQNDVYIHPKLFLFPYGVNNSEVFSYGKMIWENCTKNSDVKCPYQLDGIIFTPLEQKYTREKQSIKMNIYKYKPPETNSIDVYITFQRNKETNTYLDIYDNQLSTESKFKSFRVINFFVGDVYGGSEKPIPFMPDNNNDQAYLPLIDGQIRDVEGNIVQDNSVVEVIYNNDSSVPHNYRWIILRTRWDKTESVLRYKKKYGNYRTTAENVWRSMMEAVTIDDMKNLANPSSYNGQMKILKSKLSSTAIKAERATNKYYQLQTDLLKTLRQWHNWLKTTIITTYASPKASQSGKKPERQTILDIGCGRGGDVLKFYHTRVKEYVGFDYNYENLFSSVDSMLTRYNEAKKKYPDFPKFTIFQADGGVLLTSTAQGQAISSMSDTNKKTIDKIFTKDRQFDIYSSQFVIHYLFSSETSVNNLIENIKNHLKPGGYILLTLFDGEHLHKKFTDNKYTSMYTDEDGNRKVLFDIVKKYDGEIKDIPGQTIDVKMSWINEDDYYPEYVVTKKLMVDTMKKAGCRLVDTELFENLYHINTRFFTDTINYESNPKNKQYYKKITPFFEELKGADKESKKYSFLNRYYIFQKV